MKTSDPFYFIDEQPISDNLKQKAKNFIIDISGGDIDFDLLDELLFGVAIGVGIIQQGPARLETHLLLNRFSKHSERFESESGKIVKEEIIL